MIEELKIRVRGFEYAGKHILLDCEKTNGEKIVLKISREDLNFINGKFRD